MKLVKYYILFFLILSSAILSSQSLNAYLKAAESAISQKDYYSALDYYLNAQEFDSTRIDINYQVAESARLFHSMEYAEINYAKVIEEDTNTEYPLASFWLADVLQKQGKFESAKQFYEIYLAEYQHDDEYFTAKANKEILAVNWALEQINNPDVKYSIHILEDTVNTSYSEFGPFINDDVLYFSSLKYKQEKSKYQPNRLNAKVLEFAVDSTVRISEQINQGHTSTAHTAFSDKKEWVYYTVCDYEGVSADIRCDLFRKAISPDGKFGEGIKLPSPVNVPGFTNTQPSIGLNPKDSESELLYFVSNREGGVGKLDIWFVEIIDDGFGQVKNLSKLNTSENDITPFYHNVSQTLYFSSDGYRRIGGYDIYKTRHYSESFDEVEHLPTNVNSSFDDIYFTLSDHENTAYFSSNREGTQFIDQAYEACCFDIYKVNIDEVYLEMDALTFNKTNDENLKGATVKLLDAKTNEILQTIHSDTSHHHIFKILKGNDYLIIGEKTPFESDTIMLSTRGLSPKNVIVKKLFLDLNEIDVNISVHDEQNLEELKGAKLRIIILSDNSSEDQLLDSETGLFKLKLLPNKNYKIVAIKEGYHNSSIIIDTGKELEQTSITKKIFLKKKDLNIYLPLTLYFDNDRPDRRSYEKLTEKTYTDTYSPFMERKDVFKMKTAIRLGGEKKIRAEQKMDDFFEFDVKVGYEKMNNFLNGVSNNLEIGNEIEIVIKGYTSPLAQSRYNLNLSKRRISSVRNELSKFKSGVLLPFLETGKLKITDVSFGESLSPSSISDSNIDVTKSIYSVQASKERKVEIIKVRSLFSY